MKVTQKKALQGFSALLTVGKKVTGATAYDLFLLKQELRKVVDFQTEEEQKLVEKYGGEITETGQIIISEKKLMHDFAEEHRALGEMECEIPLEVVIDIGAVPNITMEEIEALDGLVKFKKG